MMTLMMILIIRMIAILLLLLLELLLVLPFLIFCSWFFGPGPLVQALTYNFPPEKFHPISFSFFSVSVADFSALEEGEITAEFFVWRGAKPLRNFRLPGRETTPAQLPRNFSPGIFPGIFFCIVLVCFGTKKNSGTNSGGNSGRNSGPPAGEKFRSGFAPQQTRNSGVFSPPLAAAQFCKQNLGQI